jgi:hypothetical protein
MTTDTLERRVGVLEGILGLDPEVDCRGLGEDCPDCDPGRCPHKRNNVRRLSGMLNQALDELLLVRCWVQELEATGKVPEGSWSRARTRRDLARVDTRLRRARSLVGRLGRVEESPFGKQLRHQIQELQEEQATLKRTLAEVEV